MCFRCVTPPAPTIIERRYDWPDRPRWRPSPEAETVTQTPEAATPEGTAGGRHEPAGGRTLGPARAAAAGHVLEMLLSRLRESMRADVGAVLLDQGGVLRVAAALGVSPELGSAIEEPVGHGFAGTIAATCAPGAISDTTAVEPGAAPWSAEGVRALVGVPLPSDGRALGVLVVGSRSERTFGDADI